MHLVVTPTYNERSNIKAHIERIFAHYPDMHVMVVDDNSPDGTADTVRELQQSHPNLHLKQRSGKQGLASAYLGAFREALAAHPALRAVITMDADLSHDPAVIPHMLEALREHDLVVGSRYIALGGVKNWNLWRRALSWGGNLYTRFVTGHPVRDLTGGFNCYSADLLRRYPLDEIKSQGYGFQIEMKIVARRLGARILEVPIIFSDRTAGESKISNNIIYEGLILPWRFSPLARLFSSKKKAG